MDNNLSKNMFWYSSPPPNLLMGLYLLGNRKLLTFSTTLQRLTLLVTFIVENVYVTPELSDGGNYFCSVIDLTKFLEPSPQLQ